MKIGIQLYSIRDTYTNGEEFKKSLIKIKELGYEGVEFAGYAGLQAEELRDFLSEIGLEAISSHYGVDDLEAKLEELLTYNHKLGIKIIVCAYAPTSNLEELKRLQSVMETAQEAAKAYGIKVAYHNHSEEFEIIEDGSVPMDLIKEYCELEVDTYWVFNSRVNPYDYIKENADHISLIHLKDGDLEGNPCALGEGRNDIKGILSAAQEIGTEWVIVENDHPIPDGLSDVARSMTYLKKI